MKSLKSVTVKQDPLDEVPTEVIATSIRDISEAMRKINAGRLNRRALIVLLKDATGISKAELERVLNALANLERTYCK